MRAGDTDNPPWFNTLDELLHELMSHLPNTDVETYKADAEDVGFQAVRAVDEWTHEGLGRIDLEAIRRYIGLLIAQHPLMLRARRAVFDEQFVARLTRTMGRPMSADEAAVLRHAAWDHMAKAVALLTLPDDARAHARLLASYGFVVIRRTAPPYFWLGDAGVVAAHTGIPGPGPGDLAARRSTVFLPCSPRAVIAFRPQAGDGYLDAATDVVARVNRLVWNRSAREVYGNSVVVDATFGNELPGLQFIPRPASFTFDIVRRSAEGNGSGQRQ